LIRPGRGVVAEESDECDDNDAGLPRTVPGVRDAWEELSIVMEDWILRRRVER